MPSEDVERLIAESEEAIEAWEHDAAEWSADGSHQPDDINGDYYLYDRENVRARRRERAAERRRELILAGEDPGPEEDEEPDDEAADFISRLMTEAINPRPRVMGVAIVNGEVIPVQPEDLPDSLMEMIRQATAFIGAAPTQPWIEVVSFRDEQMMATRVEVRVGNGHAGAYISDQVMEAAYRPEEVICELVHRIIEEALQAPVRFPEALTHAIHAQVAAMVPAYKRWMEANTEYGRPRFWLQDGWGSPDSLPMEDIQYHVMLSEVADRREYTPTMLVDLRAVFPGSTAGMDLYAGTDDSPERLRQLAAEALIAAGAPPESIDAISLEATTVFTDEQQALINAERERLQSEE